MSNPRRAPRVAVADAGLFLGTFALVFLGIGGLFVGDTLLARLEHAETRSEARHYFEEGERLLSQGRSLDAVDRFQAALADERTNPVYQRALAAGLLAAGDVAEVETVLTDRLQRDPLDAQASLTLARALVRQNRLREASAYYHRAIYGRWERDAEANQVRARFELATLLARQGAKRELLAELLPLQDEAATDPGTRKQIARLFIAAGSPSRAAEIFRDIARHDPSDADAIAGLGEALFDEGDYRAAQSAYLTASRLDSDSRDISARLALAGRVLSLDPTQRRLGTAEQFRRSVTLVSLALGAVVACTPTPQPATQRIIDSARTVFQAELRQASDAPGPNLDLAERLWQLRKTECGDRVPPADTALSLVLEKIAQ